MDNHSHRYVWKMSEFMSAMAGSCIDDVFCDISHYPLALSISPPLFCDAPGS